MTRLDKWELTKSLLSQTSESTDDSNVKSHYWSWWTNPISKTSLRLTEYGYTFLVDEVQLTDYQQKLSKDFILTMKVLLKLDKLMQAPFFLDRKSIYMFGESDALMLTLMDGDLSQYLVNLQS